MAEQQNLTVHQAVDVGKPNLSKPVRKLESVNANQLHGKELNPPVFTIEGLLPTGLIAFAARPKTGKSWLCLDIADSVASGKQFWNKQTVQGDVLYLALEDSEYRIRERLNQIGSEFPKTLHFVIRGAETLDAGFIEQIRDWETEHDSQLRLLIIDTIGRVKGSAKRGKNAYESDTEQFAPLQELAIEKGFSIVCVTHFSKNKFSTDPFESITGSVGMFAVADAGWVISGERNEQSKTLYVTGRDIGYDEFEIKFSGCRWEMIGNAEDIQQQNLDREYSDNPIVQTIKQLLSESNSWSGTASQIKDEVAIRTGYDLGHPNSVASKIRKIIPALVKREHYKIKLPDKNGGNDGRKYTFERARKDGKNEKRY